MDDYIDLLQLSNLKIYNSIWNKLSSQNQSLNSNILDIEGTSPMLNFDKEKGIHLPSIHSNIKTERNFTNFNISMDDLMKTISQVFVPNEANHRVYPSAGALYPVIPLFVVTKQITPELSIGIYSIDYLNKTLRKTKFNYNFEKLGECISPYNGSLLSPIFICYSFAVERTVGKYNYRGFRHMLIEVGEMSQSFRLIGKNNILNFGDASWSGFNDLQLKNNLGLHKLNPVLLQFFGVTK